MAEVELSDAEGFVDACRAARAAQPGWAATSATHTADDVKQWGEAVRKADAELGIADISIESAGHVLLPAGSRDELIA